MAAKKICCVRDCPSRHVLGEDVTYFSLPTDLQRRLQWLKVIGRPDLHQDRVAPKNYVVCSIHFDSSQISVQRQVLSNAVPTRHIPRKRKGVFIYSSNTASQTDFPSSDDDDDYYKQGKRTIDFDEKVVVHKRLKSNRKIFACLEIDYDDKVIPGDDSVVDVPLTSLSYSKNLPRDSVDLGNRKIFVFTDENPERALAPESNIVNSNVPNTAANDIVISNVFSLNAIENAAFKKFAEWRHRTTGRRKGPKFERDFKIFALNLHSINTRAYRLLMQSWHLPKEKELKEMQLNLGPRFDERMTKLLSQKFKTLSGKAKFCTLGMYVVPLKPHLFYDPANDEVIGVHNLNGLKKIEAANYAVVAMVRGLKVPWCQPVAFSLFSTMTDVENIDVFLTNIIVKLRSMGLKILGVVFADDPHFWRYCRSKHFISVLKPYLTIAKGKVFVVFDIPHVLNLFKDEFIKNDFVFENKTISWKYLKQAYEVDKQRGGRLLSKLTEEHMKVGNRDKSVMKPCQVLSRTVSGAMHYYLENGLLPKEAAPSAELIKKINDVFDVLNVNKTVRGIKNTDTQTKLSGTQTKALENGVSIFKKLASAVKADEKSQEPDSLKYFMISFKGLLYISMALKETTKTGIVQTSYTYLDLMLEFLKSIKDTKNSNKKPTPVRFSRAFSKLFLKYLIELTPAPTSIGSVSDFLKMADGVKDCYAVYGGKRICMKDREYRFCLPDAYAIIYVSSFLLYKCSEKHMCKAFEDFLNGLVDLKNTKVYVNFEKFNKDAEFYDILKLPPMELPAYVERLDNYFLKCFTDFYHSKPAETIFRALTLNVPPWDPPCPCFPYDYMLKVFVRTRIFETVLHNTRCLKNKPVEQLYTLDIKKL